MAGNRLFNGISGEIGNIFFSLGKTNQTLNRWNIIAQWIEMNFQTTESWIDPSRSKIRSTSLNHRNGKLEKRPPANEKKNDSIRRKPAPLHALHKKTSSTKEKKLGRGAKKTMDALNLVHLATLRPCLVAFGCLFVEEKGNRKMKYFYGRWWRWLKSKTRRVPVVHGHAPKPDAVDKNSVTFLFRKDPNKQKKQQQQTKQN